MFPHCFERISQLSGEMSGFRIVMVPMPHKATAVPDLVQYIGGIGVDKSVRNIVPNAVLNPLLTEAVFTMVYGYLHCEFKESEYLRKRNSLATQFAIRGTD